MTDKPFFSERTGKAQPARHDLDALRRLFNSVYSEYGKKGSFNRTIGYWDSSYGRVDGSWGNDPGGYVLRKIKRDLWPPTDRQGSGVFRGTYYDPYKAYEEHDVFDLIELLYRDASAAEDRDGLRTDMNTVLKDYQDGFELSAAGDVLRIPPSGLERLVADIPPVVADPAKVADKIAAAKTKFLRGCATLEDRKAAVRDLIDALEFVRTEVEKNVKMKKDESDLFQIANQFGIRHNKADQKTDYDQEIFFDWLFYYYLAAVTACLKLLSKANVSVT